MKCQAPGVEVRPVRDPLQRGAAGRRSLIREKLEEGNYWTLCGINFQRSELEIGESEKRQMTMYSCGKYSDCPRGKDLMTGLANDPRGDRLQMG